MLPRPEIVKPYPFEIHAKFYTVFHYKGDLKSKKIIEQIEKKLAYEQKKGICKEHKNIRTEYLKR